MIQREVAKLSIAYPYPERGDAELEVLTDMWVEDFEGMSDGEFVERVKAHRRRSRFFPTSHDLLSIELEWTRPHAHKELPAQPTQLSDQEVAKNKEKVGKLLKILESKKAM